MKTLTLFLLLFSGYSSLYGQGMEGLLRKVSEALSEGKYGQASGFFRQAIYSDLDKAETYYHTHLSSSVAQCPQLALELAGFYKKGGNYERAGMFAAHLVEHHPYQVEYLDLLAEAEMYTGNKQNALSLYERILEVEPDHLAANIYVGNYYFFMAEKKKRSMDTEYRKKGLFSRKHTVEYADGLFTLYMEDYRKAKSVLENVMRIFPSSEVGRTLLKIGLIEEELNKIKGEISLL